MNENTYARAKQGYDEAHERALAEAIIEAIVTSSKVSDANALVIRTSEATSALLSVLAFVLALSPAVTRNPGKTIAELRRRLRRQIAAATTHPDLQEFLRHVFRGDETKGHA